MAHRPDSCMGLSLYLLKKTLRINGDDAHVMGIISDSFLAIIPMRNPPVTFVGSTSEIYLNLSTAEKFGCHVFVQGIAVSGIDDCNRLHFSSLF